MIEALRPSAAPKEGKRKPLCKFSELAVARAGRRTQRNVRAQPIVDDPGLSKRRQRQQ